MTTKTISIKKEVYDILISMKRMNESFSDLFLRLAEKEKPMTIIKDIIGTMDLGDTDTLIQEIHNRCEDWRG
ncbi:MAG: antitoxin VapB family protein [Candidatus Lokiarchaeota archaeon]|nr:antitoxin VapB family protein [Candidatus Lokiarchaeota archaeon]